MILQQPRDCNVCFYVLIETLLEGWCVALWMTTASTQDLPLIPGLPHPPKESLLTNFISEKWEHHLDVLCFLSRPYSFISWWGLNPGLTHARQSLSPIPILQCNFYRNLIGEKVSFLFCGCWGSGFGFSRLCCKHLLNPLNQPPATC